MSEKDPREPFEDKLPEEDEEEIDEFEEANFEDLDEEEA